MVIKSQSSTPKTIFGVWEGASILRSVLINFFFDLIEKHFIASFFEG